MQTTEISPVMPVPPLPLDIVSEILSNFHSSSDSDREALEAADAVGRAVSLVCRAWSPLGQALLWRQLKLDLLQTSSLLHRFRSYSHLIPLVHDLVVQYVSRESEDDKAQEEKEEKEKNSTLLLDLVGKLSNLRSLHIALNWSNLDDIIVVCSKLPSLESLFLYGQKLLVSAQVDSAFNEGFPVLRDLSLLPGEVKFEDDAAQQVSKEEDQSSKRLKEEEDKEERKPEEETNKNKERPFQELMLVIDYPDELTCTRFVKCLRSTLGWSNLRRCFIGKNLVNKEILSDLASLPTLKELSIWPGEQDFGEFFSMLLSVLPQFTNLEGLSIETNEDADEDEDDFIEPPIDIWTFLDLIPQSLRMILLPQVEWDRDDFYEFPDASRYQRQGKEAHRQLVTLSSRIQPLILLEYDTEDGKQWCQPGMF
ncbi:hypothetical protein JCM3765_005829 [Sporobolomyces pararoseus]